MENGAKFYLRKIGADRAQIPDSVGRGGQLKETDGVKKGSVPVVGERKMQFLKNLKIFRIVLNYIFINRKS